jgi:subtilisin
MPTKREELESRTMPAAGRPAVATGTRDRNDSSTQGENVVASSKRQFLISARVMPGFSLFPGLDSLERDLKNDPAVKVVDVLTPRSTPGAFGDGLAGSQRVIVARMQEERAARLVQQGGYQLIVERDHPLTYGHSAVPFVSLDGGGVHATRAFTANITVMGNDVPVEAAQVYVFGDLFPVQGVTDRQGRVQLNLLGESPGMVRAIYVKPQSDFWSLWIPQPNLNAEGANIISLTSLSATLPNFAHPPFLGWGQRLMRLDNLAPAFRGKGVKVAVIDSGAATSHRNIKGQVKSGYDAVTKGSDSWEEDALGYGTHCVGIISGNAENSAGIRGFAPDAEVIACKVLPGGHYSSLLDALDFCISRQVDIINLSVGAAEPSEILEQKLFQAKQLGIAVIAAAGNSGGPVQYPASSPNVLAVTAIGKYGEFPPDSYHAQTVRLPVTPEGFFSPSFTCVGPQIAVCAPGVAIASSAPPDNFAAWDGTPIAASHVTGLATLILAHHPDFQVKELFGGRSGQRVDRLFQIIRQSAQPLNLGDPLRTGAGLPDAARAFLPYPLEVGVPATAYPVISHALRTAAPYFAGNPFGSQGIGAGSGAQIPYIPFWAGRAPVQFAPGRQSPEEVWLLAVQQLRSAMQSVGLL